MEELRQWYWQRKGTYVFLDDKLHYGSKQIRVVMGRSLEEAHKDLYRQSRVGLEKPTTDTKGF